MILMINMYWINCFLAALVFVGTKDLILVIIYIIILIINMHCINCFFCVGTNDLGLLTRDYRLVHVTGTGLLYVYLYATSTAYPALHYLQI